MKAYPILLVLALTVNVFAGDWTPAQKQAVREWMATQGTKDTPTLVERINRKPITGYNEWDEPTDAQPLQKLAYTEAKRIAIIAGITKTDTLAQMDTKLQQMVSDAGTTAQIKVALYNASKFWVCYFQVQDVDSDGTSVLHHKDPVYGESFADEYGLGVVTGDRLELLE